MERRGGRLISRQKKKEGECVEGGREDGRERIGGVPEVLLQNS